MSDLSNQEKTHRDFQAVIGETTATGKTPWERGMNRYYYLGFTRAIRALLKGIDPKGKTVMDVGTSHGVWFDFFRTQGFKTILGVELDEDRAAQARAKGYDKVYHADAVSVPHPSASVDVVVSTDVFVHILRLQDKAAVLREVHRLLKPGGVFIVNHPISEAFGYQGYRVEGHCSFLSLREWQALCTEGTGFEVAQVSPTYFEKQHPRDLLTRGLRRFIHLPGAPAALHFWEGLATRRLPPELADTVYLKLEKTGETARC